MKRALLALACLALAATSSISAQSPACAPSNGLNFICGLQKLEDLVPIPGTGWLIAQRHGSWRWTAPHRHASETGAAALCE